jgi:hypothetical protein
MRSRRRWTAQTRYLLSLLDSQLVVLGNQAGSDQNDLLGLNLLLSTAGNV